MHSSLACRRPSQVTHNLQAHAGGGITVIPPNIWQDNFLTGTTPFAIYPRVVATTGAPIQYGFQITPDQLPRAYTPAGIDIFAKWKSQQVPANTVMDVDRYEKDLTALTHVSSPLNLSGIDRSFGNATMFTWTMGLEQKFGNLTGDASIRGHRKPETSPLRFPQCICGSLARLRTSHPVR